MASFGDPAELVGDAGQTFADELEQPVMDRPWFCSAYAAAGYFMCDPLTNIPKWCQTNMADIWCPNDVGYEYDSVTGGGGSSGGSGAKRTWDVNKCFGDDFKYKPCLNMPKKGDNICLGFFLMDQETKKAVKGAEVTYQMFQSQPTMYTLGSFPCNDLVQCYSSDMVRIDCNQALGTGWHPFVPNTAYVYNGKCVSNNDYVNTVPCKFNISTTNLDNGSTYRFDNKLRFRDPITGIIIENEKIQNGYPVPIVVPPVVNPFDPNLPVSTEECATIICECISFVVKALGVVNASVLKVDESVLKVVSAVTNFKPSLPEPLDLKAVTDELQRILKAIDDISVEMVKEAGTNFWDVLGGAFGDIFDLVEFLIEKVIYLVIPEDSSSIINAFDLLRADLISKVSPIHAIQQHITDSIPNEQKEFENIKIVLPKYGEVTFFKSDYLLLAMPFIRQLLAAIMVILTSIWAYRKVSSEMVK